MKAKKYTIYPTSKRIHYKVVGKSIMHKERPTDKAIANRNRISK